MAIYHLSVKNISRAEGRSAIAAAAYRSGTKIEDKETGITHDYTRKSGIEYTEIILCENAPEAYRDREILWSEVQKVEKPSNARLAREWEVAIPRELTLEQGQQLVHDFAQTLADEGMCVDAAIHDKGDGNRHAHILGTVRAIKENGDWAPKSRKVYELDEQGRRIPLIDKKTGLQKLDSQNRKQWKSHKEDYTDWNKADKVEEWRERWATYCNRYLDVTQQIDHRSYERQGVEKLPTIHEGYVARAMESRGEVSERCEANRETAGKNSLLEGLTELLKHLAATMQYWKERAEKELYERLQRVGIARTASVETGRNESREGAAGTSYQQTYRGEFDILIASARAAIRNTRAKEQNAGAERAHREAEQERLNLERQRAAAERQRQAEERERRSRKQSQDYDIDL